MVEPDYPSQGQGDAEPRAFRLGLDELAAIQGQQCADQLLTAVREQVEVCRALGEEVGPIGRH